MPEEISPGERTRLRYLARPDVLGDENKPNRRIRRRETCRRSTVERVFGIGGHHSHREDLYECEPALNHIIGVKAGGEDRVAGPRPPDQCEEWCESHEPRDGVVLAQRFGNLADGGDEDQVEEQFEPCDSPSSVRVKRAQPKGRDEVRTRATAGMK